ncbi:hypothetical protein V1288_000786 [Bradyrhizobium sp. AZCC 2176]
MRNARTQQRFHWNQSEPSGFYLSPERPFLQTKRGRHFHGTMASP